jgi:hypothetical protein
MSTNPEKIIGKVREVEGLPSQLCGLATLHGLAHLVVEEKATHFLQGANAKNFVKDYLPQGVERLYPKVAYTGCIENRY